MDSLTIRSANGPCLYGNHNKVLIHSVRKYSVSNSNAGDK